MADDGGVTSVNACPVLGKFSNPDCTADGDERARVSFNGLKTLWINTGTLCNVECVHCYIESSPTNDRLVYLKIDEATPFLDEAREMGAAEIGFTGGEPFMNPDMIAMLEAALAQGFDTLVLTNAMRPMMRSQIKSKLLALHRVYGCKIKLRVSLDHFSAAKHDEERGEKSFDIGLEGLRWLSKNGFSISVASRLMWDESEQEMRGGFSDLFAENDIPLDGQNSNDLVLFPEMDERAAVPEITTRCWKVLNVNPNDMMCASSRMLVKRKGAASPAVLSCTLLAYDKQFEMGHSLAEAARPVKLNHAHCAKFCVLGGASCSG